MPLYDFHCTECGKTAEMLVRSSDKPACPACGSMAVKRLFPRVAAPGKSKKIISAARAQARREGHFSNY